MAPFFRDWWWLAGGATPAPRVDLAAWRGAITFLLGNQPQFTAQGYDSWHPAELRAALRAQYRSEGYTHWPYGPLLQRAYVPYGPSTDFRGGPDWWPLADYRSTPEQFLARAQELRQEGIVPCLFLLDDQGVYAAEHGGVNRAKIEAELTPLYSRPEWQATFPIVVAAWEPQWPADDWGWVVAWMARVWPHARRAIHFPAGKGAPGRHEDFTFNGGHYADEAEMWNQVIPHLHDFLIQETHVFGAGRGYTEWHESIQDGRTRIQQYLYDLMDISRRFRYGSGDRAPHSGPEVERWNTLRGTSGKSYRAWNGSYLTACAGGDPLHVVSFEYSSFLVKQDVRLYDEGHTWGAMALEINGVHGFGDGGPLVR